MIELTVEVKGPGNPVLTNSEYKSAKKVSQRRIALVNEKTGIIRSG